MSPPSPTKFPMSPGMPLFPVSPERAAGTKPPYGAAPDSPSLPDLRMSPLRSPHRRNDSDVSSLASMFEGLAVKDQKEAQQRWMQAMQRQKAKHASDMQEIERKQRLAIERYEVRFDELKTELRKAQRCVEHSVSKDDWDRQRQDHRAAISKWEDAMKKIEEAYRQAQKKAHELSVDNNTYKSKAQQYKKKSLELHKENLRVSGQIPALQTEIQSLKRSQRLTESDLKFYTGEADKYKNQVYGLQVDLESLETRLGEEMQTVADKLKLVEAERDALKTSLKEEEVLRIAAQGQIPLPAATVEEHDEFGSPVRSPRKQRTPERDEEDKENVAPKRAVVELKLVQQELVSERRLRLRAQEQIDFMKMECQFRICSCRIADMKGSEYVHDNSFASEMAHIKSAVPNMTPPSSNHGDDVMQDIVVDDEPSDHAMPSPALLVEAEHSEQLCKNVDEKERSSEPIETHLDSRALPRPSRIPESDNDLAFSPTTGTFKMIPPTINASAPMQSTPLKSSHLGLSAITERTRESSPWTPDANSTVIHHEAEPSHTSAAVIDEESASEEPASPLRSESRLQTIEIHEDPVIESDDEEDCEPQTPLHGPTGPATPGQYLTRTITTTTTVPLHFSPMTPAVKGADQALTPSTIAHPPTTSHNQVLGEISLNKLPFDREAALEAIRQRRGRARSMAAGQGTPHKQMMEGVGPRRDISAPVARVRR